MQWCTILVCVCHWYLQDFCLIYLQQWRRYMFSPSRPRLFVCLSVCVQDYSKARASTWIKCCVSTDVGTWTNWLTFEPDPDYSPDVGTGLLSPIAYALQREVLLRWENTATHGFESYALQRGILWLRENATYWNWAPSNQRRGFEA